MERGPTTTTTTTTTTTWGRKECPRCRRPEVVCYCAHVRPIRTRTRVLIVQHPREHRMAIGTAWMASMCLVDSELRVGLGADDDPRVIGALSDPEAPPVLLYPGKGAVPLESLEPGVRRTLVVVDGTWDQSRVVLRESRRLRELPRVGLQPTRPSEYRIRGQPRPECVSTIEALYLALGILEGGGVDLEPLLTTFRAMVQMQIDARERRRALGLPPRTALFAGPKRREDEAGGRRP